MRDCLSLMLPKRGVSMVWILDTTCGCNAVVCRFGFRSLCFVMGVSCCSLV